MNNEHGTIEFKPIKPQEIPTHFSSNNGIVANIDTSLNGIDTVVFSQATFHGAQGADQKYRYLRHAIDNETGNYIVIENTDSEAIIYLFSKSGKQLSKSTIPNILPSTNGQKNKYLYLNEWGQLVWHVVAGEYYSGIGIEVDENHRINLLYDVTYFNIIDGILTLNTDELALKTDLEKKQDKVQFTILPFEQGILDGETLQQVVADRENKLVYNNKIYYHTSDSGLARQYTAGSKFVNDSTALNTIILNTATGVYRIVSLQDKYLEDHINNTTVHITQAERNYWNNKVSVKTEQNTPTANNYTLIFEK